LTDQYLIQCYRREQEGRNEQINRAWTKAGKDGDKMTDGVNDREERTVNKR